MRTAKILVVGVTSAAMVLSMSLAGSAQAASPSDPVTITALSSSDGNASSGNGIESFATQASAEQYWSPSRMASAIPAEGTVPVDGADAPVPEGSGPAGASTARTQVAGSNGSLAAAKIETVRDPVTRPYSNRFERLNGKVFFTRGGFDYVCSGTVVNSPSSKDMVDTAGHCVNDGAGSWSQNFVFVPAYNSSNGNTFPYGIWSARTLTTRAEWSNRGNFKQDLGYALLQPLNGRHIVNYLGGQGSSFNMPRTQKFTAFGYPASPSSHSGSLPFNGNYQREASSNSSGAGDNPYSRWAGPNTMRMTSYMTGGCSGGGWIIGMSAKTGLGYLNGHNDYRYISGPKASARYMYSPYYGAEALSLFNFTKSL